jgi:hypothetical protein
LQIRQNIKSITPICLPIVVSSHLSIVRLARAAGDVDRRRRAEREQQLHVPLLFDDDRSTSTDECVVALQKAIVGRCCANKRQDRTQCHNVPSRSNVTHDRRTMRGVGASVAKRSGS